MTAIIGSKIRDKNYLIISEVAYQKLGLRKNIQVSCPEKESASSRGPRMLRVIGGALCNIIWNL